MVFSDPTTRTGVVQLLEDLTTTQSATSFSYPLATKTRDINNAYANYMMVANRVSGGWEVDDTNQTDYPVITTNLVANQQDYSFTVDGSTVPNQILDIYRVEILNTSGLGVELYPLDEREIKGQAITEFLKTAGTPTYYRKTANGIFLDAKPSYSSTGGLRIYYARTPVYFTTSDTTKRPGIPDMFHEYLAMRPAYFYCLQKGMPRAQAYNVEMTRMEQRIEEYYAMRERDTPTRIRTVRRSSR